MKKLLTLLQIFTIVLFSTTVVHGQSYQMNNAIIHNSINLRGTSVTKFSDDSSLVNQSHTSVPTEWAVYNFVMNHRSGSGSIGDTSVTFQQAINNGNTLSNDTSAIHGNGKAFLFDSTSLFAFSTRPFSVAPFGAYSFPMTYFKADNSSIISYISDQYYNAGYIQQYAGNVTIGGGNLNSQVGTLTIDSILHINTPNGVEVTGGIPYTPGVSTTKYMYLDDDNFIKTTDVGGSSNDSTPVPIGRGLYIDSTITEGVGVLVLDTAYVDSLITALLPAVMDTTPLHTEITDIQTALAGKEPVIPTGTSTDYIAGDKTIHAFPTIGPSPNLQQVTDSGSYTTNYITIYNTSGLDVQDAGFSHGHVLPSEVGVVDTHSTLLHTSDLEFSNNSKAKYLKPLESTITVNSTNYLPKTGGTLVTDVNGNLPDSNGHVSITVGANADSLGHVVASGYVQTSTTVNGHALSSNVTVSASDLTTGTLPHAQLPTLVSGDIPNNVANTTGTAGGLSANITESQVTNLTTDLAAKQNVIPDSSRTHIVYSNNSGIAHTGTTTKDTILTFDIPANQLGVNGHFDINFLVSINNDANPHAWNIYFNTSTLAMPGISISGTVGARFLGQVFNRGSLSSQVFYNSTQGFGSSTSGGVSTMAQNTGAVIHVAITQQNSTSTSDTGTLEAFTLTAVN